GQAGPVHAVCRIDANSGSHYTSCDQCHGSTVVDPKRKNAEFDFAPARCDVCHAASGAGSVVAAHQALGVPITAPYVEGDPNNSTACLGCHPDGGGAAAGVAYTHSWFPVGPGTLHALGAPAVHAQGQFQCASCHTALTSDPAKIDCTGCHTQSQMKSSTGLAFHAAVPDLTWPAPATPQETSLLCLKCHADSNVPASVSYSTSSSKGNHDLSALSRRWPGRPDDRGTEPRLVPARRRRYARAREVLHPRRVRRPGCPAVRHLPSGHREPARRDLHHLPHLDRHQRRRPQC